MKRRINFQYMMLAFIAIFTTVVMSTVVFYNLLKKEVKDELITCSDIIMQSSDIKNYVSSDNKNLSSINFTSSNLRITIIDEKGNAVFDSDANAEAMENHNERPEVLQAHNNGSGYSVRTSQTLGKSAFYYAVLLDNNNILRVSKETSSMTGIIIHALPLLFVLCIMLFIICIVFSHMLTKSIVKPIENLAQNLDNTASAQPEVYKELIPFVTTIQKQHTDIKRNANLRQEFTANVSHELKTPLTSISGYSELIESGMATDDDVRRFAGEIHKSSKRLLTLINDIIRLSQLDHVTDDERFEPINLYETAKNCVEMLEKSASDHQITLNLTGKDIVINANLQMMDELIYNLCDNAIRYNNPGGTVNVSLTSNENNVILEVKDTGIGIPKEHQDRIFERFYRVDKSRSKSTGGTGLGLAIVKHIVAKHNAEIELESEVGKGTTIRVIFALNR